MIAPLVENIIRQADYFLKECNEFYPFATVIGRKGEIKPFGILLENDRPHPEIVLKELQKVLASGLSLGEYQAYAIGINVSLNQEKSVQDAIEIRIFPGSELNPETLYLPYTLDRQTREIEFGDFLTKEK